MTEQEEWRVIEDFSNYEVSNLGRVRNRLSLVILKPSSVPYIDRLHVCLCRSHEVKTVTIHKLVANAFLGSCPPNYEINHIDLDHRNNRADNLEYLTHADNQKHSVKVRGKAWGACDKPSAFNTDEAEKVRLAYARVPSYAAVGRMFNVSPTTIKRVVHGRDGIPYKVRGE